MTIEIALTEHDWERLSRRAFRWGPNFANQAEYFENYTSREAELENRPARADWAWAYDVGPEWVGVLFARAYLRGLGADHEVVWDMATSDEATYLILCNLVPRGYDEKEQSSGE
ncbi:hypothetical protein ABZ281_00655 [Streptomyces sp. NPDC006265]|uniref:hypothetical protein n=1 Tax=Streptomyces sp. NPDC006265 TaxID=3156740 RepID=UPI0033A1C278